MSGNAAGDRSAAMAALIDHLARHGTAKDFSGSIREKLALLDQAKAQGLIGWDDGRLRLGFLHMPARTINPGFLVEYLVVACNLQGIEARMRLEGRRASGKIDENCNEMVTMLC